MIEVTVQKFNLMGPNGDRATTETPYSEWKVKVGDFTVMEFSEFDHFYTSIGTGGGTLERKVQKYALDLADALGALPPRFVTMELEVVHEEKWIEIESE